MLKVATQLAAAMQAAHEADIVHRDIKPENIMLRRDGFVKVLDFGLAKLGTTQESPAVTQSPILGNVKTNPGMVMGTAAYMSPEQARVEVDAQTDIWSIGVVLYEMVAGHTPFRGETPSHVIVSILESEPPPLSGDAQAPGELERIISKALRKESAERYRNAGDLALELKKLKEELTVESRLKQLGQSRNLTRDQASNQGAEASTGRAQISKVSSSAEYLVEGIKRHKRGAVFTCATVFILMASFLYFSGSSKGGDAIDSVAVLSFVNDGGDPEFDSLRSDSRYVNLVRRMGLEP